MGETVSKLYGTANEKIVGLVSFKLRLNKCSPNGCDLFLTSKGIVLIKAGNY